MQLTDEQFATLAPYEAHFTTALRSSYPRSPGRLALKTIHAVLRELEPTTPALNTTCGTCILRVLKKAGRLYFDRKEADAAEASLAAALAAEAVKKTIEEAKTETPENTPKEPQISPSRAKKGNGTKTSNNGRKSAKK